MDGGMGDSEGEGVRAGEPWMGVRLPGVDGCGVEEGVPSEGRTERRRPRVQGSGSGFCEVEVSRGWCRLGGWLCPLWDCPVNMGFCSGG